MSEEMEQEDRRRKDALVRIARRFLCGLLLVGILYSLQATPMSEAIDSYVPTAKQLEFHKSTHYMRGFIGGFGAGKTKCGIWEGIDQSMRQPGNRGLIMRDTMGDLKDTTMATFFEECPPEFIYTYRKKEQQVIFQNGSEILFRSFRMYKTSTSNQNEGKLKGLNVGWFYLDEANEVTREQFLFLHGRLRLDAVTWRGGWLTTNPTSEDHWIYEMFDGPNADKKRYHVVHASSRENEHLPPEFVKNLEREYGPSMAKKFIDGEYGRLVVGDPVYPDFKETNAKGDPWHARPTKFRSQYGTVYRMWDFGWHRPAVSWSQVTPSGIWKIHKEYMGDKVYIQDFAPRVIDISNSMFAGAKFTDFGDPAGNQKSDKTDKTTMQILKDDFKINVRSRFSLIKEGLDLIQNKMTRVIEGEPAFQINPDECPILVAGLAGGYVRAKAVDGRGMESSEPVKDGYYEHLQDSIRMGAVNLFGSNNSGTKGGSFPIGAPSFGGQAVSRANSVGGGNGWKERPSML